MPLDKNWINIGDRRQIEYIRGVDDFLEFAFKNTTSNLIQCPCKNCRNILSEQHGQVRFHLLKHGFMKSYRVWYFHGEAWNNNDGVDNDTSELNDETDYDDMEGLVNDIAGGDVAFEEDVENLNDMDTNIPNNSAAMFYGLLEAAKEKVYPGCQHSKLGAIVKLLHLKSLHRWTNRSFDALMEFLGELVPKGKKVLPSSFNDA
ncbi:MAG: hypothetical protein Q8807_03245 ['Waltheria sp.' little leaf phytoplasma]|nr:hypothetical protein ['Waltheria sp.' little leaf phytoplasma]